METRPRRKTCERIIHAMGTTLFLCFSTFQPDSNLSAENRARPSYCCNPSSLLADTALVYNASSPIYRQPSVPASAEHLLTQPHNNALHPLRKQLKLMACKVSGKASSSATYQRRLQQPSCSHGQMGLGNNINCTSSSGLTFVVNDRLIPTIHL